MTIKMEKIKADDVLWGGRAKWKYYAQWEVIRGLKVGEAIKITLEEPNRLFGTVALQNFRAVKADFKIRTKKLDRVGQVWAIQKIRR